MALKVLIAWAIQNKAKGSIELRYHNAELPDSVFIFRTENNDQKLVWDLGFGRDLNQKRVIIFNPEAPLGNDLKSRYTIIFNEALCKIRYSNGNITCNKFNWEFPDNIDKSNKPRVE